jgi:hypothetical protein
MSSFLAWLDHSEHERRRMLDVIDLFREQETRDELGIGTIRDGLADLLFPGTSTIQTRARYFLFVPWVYRGIEEKRLSGAEAAQKARKDEVALIRALVKAGEKEGVIGVEAGEKLKRLPSAIYWQGLGAWGIRLFRGSQDQYIRALARIHESRSGSQRDDDGEPIGSAGDATWDRRLPPPPKDVFANCTLGLTPTESEYLGDRISSRCRGTLLAWLIEDGQPWATVPFPWEHPRASAFPPAVTEQLHHARLFSETLHGAALLYNLMLAEASPNRTELKDDYRQDLEDWAARIEARADALIAWDESRFWQIVRSRGAQVGPLAQGFVSQWVSLVKAAKQVKALADDATARELIRKREKQLKKEQARLQSARALERWGGAAGAGQLNFRWGKTERIALDILAGKKSDA